MHSAGDGKDELAQGASEDAQRLAEEAQHQMSGFVKDQVHTVEEVVFVGNSEPHDVDRQPSQQHRSRRHTLGIGTMTEAHRPL